MSLFKQLLLLLEFFFFSAEDLGLHFQLKLALAVL
jgi:hypothetical protein